MKYTHMCYLDSKLFRRAFVIHEKVKLKIWSFPNQKLPLNNADKNNLLNGKSSERSLRALNLIRTRKDASKKSDLL